MAYEDLIGPQGYPGRDGIDGSKGDKGDRGDPGKDGRDGIDGVNGKDGIDGLDGVPGPKGDKGDQGDRGPEGKVGKEGPKGDDGRDGIDGRDGKDGKDGINGLPGKAGKDGKDGAQGPQGEDGHTPQLGIDYYVIHGKDGRDGSDVDPATLAGYLRLDQTLVQTVSDGAPTFSGGINTTELCNSAGSLKIMPDVQGNVDLFGDTDVANGVDGKIFSVNRRAAEGDTTISIFGNDDQWAHFCANWDMSIYSTVANGVIEIGSIPTNIVRLIGTVNAIGEPVGTENLPLRHYGYITADLAQRYITWLLDDTDDYFHLTRSDTNILGLKIEMPLDLGSNGINSTGLTEHDDNAAALLAGHVVGDFYRTGDILKVVH